MQINLPNIGFKNLMSRTSGMWIYGIVIVLIGVFGSWGLFGESVKAWVGIGLSWLVGIALIGATLVTLSKGFAGQTSLDEYNELLSVAVSKVRTGQPIDPALSQIILATAIRTGLLLVASGIIMMGVLDYLHPLG